MRLTINSGSAFTSVQESDILSLKTIIKVDEMSASLPIDELKATIRWTSDEDIPLTHNAKITVFTRLEQVGQYFCRNVKKMGNVYTFEAVSKISILADANFAGKYFPRGTLFSEAVQAIIGNTISYQFEDEAQDFDVEGFIGHCSQREAIRHLCMSAGVTVYNQGGNIIFRRMFGGALSDTMYDRYSYQQDQVFNDYVTEDVDTYSHYSVDVYTFSTDPISAKYVTDPTTKTTYYYTSEKVTELNPDYPEDKPKNELYVQGEHLITSYGMAASLISDLKRYYSGGKRLNFRVVGDKAKKLGVGFYDNEKMIFGYPAETEIDYAIDNNEDSTHSISYVCNMAYTEEPRHIVINYKNDAGEILTRKTIVKGGEDSFDVRHPVITVAIDTSHKAIYVAPEKTSTFEDDIFEDPSERDVICKLAAVQSGRTVEIYNVDFADQSENKLFIRGKNYV